MFQEVTLEELCIFASKDEASVKESVLLDFILAWGKTNSVNPTELAQVLEYVRFSKLTLQEFYEYGNLGEMAPFWNRIEVVESLEQVRKLHEGPVTTRRTSKMFINHYFNFQFFF